MDSVAFLNTENPMGSNGDESIIEIHVSAHDVVKLDMISQSDPFCVLLIKNNNNEFVEFARTEIIWNDANPKWSHSFKAKYVFETLQPLRFAVYDGDKENQSLSECSLVGSCDTDMQQLIMNMSESLEMNLKLEGKNEKRGVLKIDSVSCQTSSNSVSGVLETKDISKLALFTNNNLFFQISKIAESGSDLVVYRSLVIPKNNNPTFNPFCIDQGKLCNDDMQVPLIVSIFSYNANSAADLVGKCEGNLQYFLDNVGNYIDIKNGDGKVTGKIIFKKLVSKKHASTVDYIRSGIRINLIPAVDFSGSNGSPSCSYSLHYYNSNGLNQYQQCIQAVGAIVCPLDSNQVFEPLFFGAQYGCCASVTQCYPMTLNKLDPYVHGLDGIMEAYNEAVRTVSFSGPTYFGEIIEEARKSAEKAWDKDKTYTILLILTDGGICDLDNTIKQIVAGSKTALSIIIVGIGNANFSSMDILDADVEPLTSNGDVMVRDIVQFVPFCEFQSKGKEALAAAVLKEVPMQLNEFCAMKNFYPE